MKIPMLISLVLMLAVSGMCSEDFKDVPEDHWAADAVSMLAEACRAIRTARIAATSL